MSGWEAALALGAALLGGGVNSVAGGGSLIMYPSLLAVGLPSVSANVTTTMAAWPGYLTGAASYRSQLREDRRLAVEVTVVALFGAVAGTVLLLTAPASFFDRAVPWLVLGATALLGAQPVISKALAKRRGHVHSSRWLLPALALASAYGAYFGGGLGIILLAVLSLSLSRPLGELNGVKTLISLAANTVALIGFGLFGPVHWGYVALMAPASFIGGITGARLAKHLDARVLRAVVVVFGVGVGLRLLLTS